MAEELPQISLHDVLKDSYSYEQYMEARRQHKMKRTSWTFRGYTSSRWMFWESKYFNFSIYLVLRKFGYYVGIGSDQIGWGNREVGYFESKRLAEKVLKIVQDYLDQTRKEADPLVTWQSIEDIYFEENKTLVEGKELADVDISATDTWRTPPRELKDIYDRVFNRVKQKYQIMKPKLMIYHRPTHVHGEYSFRDREGKLVNTIWVMDYLTPERAELTMTHELCHAIVHQYGLDTAFSHGYYFMKIYKILTGRDYFEGQESAEKEEHKKLGTGKELYYDFKPTVGFNPQEWKKQSYLAKQKKEMEQHEEK